MEIAPEAPMDPAPMAASESSPEAPEAGPVAEDSLESSMMASMDAEAAVPVVADENAAAREEVLEAIPAGGDLSPVDETPVDAMESVVHEEPVLVSSDNVISISEGVTMNPSPEEPVMESMSESPDGSSDASSDGGPVAGGMTSSIGAVASLESMEIDASGKFVFTFSGGASITVDPTVIPFGGSRKLKFAGKEIVVGANAKGFNIAVDGLQFHMPLEAA